MKKTSIKSIDKKSAKPMVVITCSFEFPITNQEAYEYKKNPKGKVAKVLRKYILGVMDAACDKCLEEYKKEKENFDIDKLEQTNEDVKKT